MLNRLLELLDENFPAIIFSAVMLLIGILVWLLFIVLHNEARAKESFMRQCMQDRKEYECVAMWRAGQQQMVPVVIPMVVR